MVGYNPTELNEIGSYIHCSWCKARIYMDATQHWRNENGSTHVCGGAEPLPDVWTKHLPFKEAIQEFTEFYGRTPAPPIRKFETGATRASDVDKYDYEGFLSPSVIHRFGSYMHKHRVQADGTLRDSDNWQKGIPRAQYVKSLLRHVLDVWADNRSGRTLTGEELQDALCAVIFNAQGLLFEILKEDKAVNGRCVK